MLRLFFFSFFFFCFTAQERRYNFSHIRFTSEAVALLMISRLQNTQCEHRVAETTPRHTLRTITDLVWQHLLLAGSHYAEKKEKLQRQLRSLSLPRFPGIIYDSSRQPPTRQAPFRLFA